MNRQTDAVEDRAELVAWELLAPRADVLSHIAHHASANLSDLLVHRYGLPTEVASKYGAFLSRLTGRTGENWLDLGE